MNLCRSCKRDFGSTSAFDGHRVGKHAYTYSQGLEMEPMREDGRRCLRKDEMEALGWKPDSNQRWRQPLKQGGLSFTHARRAAQTPDSGRRPTSPTEPVSPQPGGDPPRKEDAHASRDRHGDIDPGVADVRPSGAARVPDEHRVALEVGPGDHRHGGQAGRVGADHAVAGGCDHGSCDGDAVRRVRVQPGVDAGGSCSDGSELRERRLADRYVGSRAMAGSPGAPRVAA